MGRQWKRLWNLTVSGGKGGIDLSNLRIRWATHQASTQAPGNAEFRVYNLSEDTANMLVQPGEFTQVNFSIGYEETGLSEIFVGDIKQFRKGKENPVDTFLDIFASHENKAYTHAYVNKSLKAGSTPQDHLDAFVEGFQRLGVGKGFIDTLPQTKYPRGVAFFGMARDYVRTLSHSNGMVWTILDSKLTMVKATGSIPGSGPYKVNSETGLIGIPVQTIGGIQARVLANPIYKWHGQIQINQADITEGQLQLTYSAGVGSPGVTNANQFPSRAADGIYNIIAIEGNGDSRGTPWYYDLLCIAASDPKWIGAQNFYLGGTSNP